MEFSELTGNRNNPGKRAYSKSKSNQLNSSVENFSTKQTIEASSTKQTVEDSKLSAQSKSNSPQSTYKRFKSSSSWGK